VTGVFALPQDWLSVSFYYGTIVGGSWVRIRYTGVEITVVYTSPARTINAYIDGSSVGIPVTGGRSDRREFACVRSATATIEIDPVIDPASGASLCGMADPTMHPPYGIRVDEAVSVVPGRNAAVELSLVKIG